MACKPCNSNGCCPDVCTCKCHPAPTTIKAKIRKVVGIPKNPPGSKGWKP